jgi:hypothetical protein
MEPRTSAKCSDNAQQNNPSQRLARPGIGHYVQSQMAFARSGTLLMPPSAQAAAPFAPHMMTYVPAPLFLGAPFPFSASFQLNSSVLAGPVPNLDLDLLRLNTLRTYVDAASCTTNPPNPNPTLNPMLNHRMDHRERHFETQSSDAASLPPYVSSEETKHQNDRDLVTVESPDLVHYGPKKRKAKASVDKSDYIGSISRPLSGDAGLEGSTDKHEIVITSKKQRLTLCNARSTKGVLVYMERDHDALNDYQCILRKQIELFEA